MALAPVTAITALGGYPTPPNSWIRASASPLFQMGAMSLLVWQAGHTPLIPSILIALLVIHIIYLWTDIENDYERSSTIRADSTSSILLQENYFNPRFFNGAIPTKLHTNT